MSFLKRQTFWITSFVLITGILIGYYAFDQLSAHENETVSKFAGNALITTNRDRLNICVDSTLESSEWIVPRAREMLVSKDFSVQIDNGCPFKPFLSIDGSEHPIYGNGEMVGRYIEEPSMYRFAVFIVDETLIREKFANASTRWSPEEMLCENSECNEVTLSIYLSEQDITNDNGKKFQQEILYLLGLERPQIRAKESHGRKRGIKGKDASQSSRQWKQEKESSGLREMRSPFLCC